MCWSPVPLRCIGCGIECEAILPKPSRYAGRLALATVAKRLSTGIAPLINTAMPRIQDYEAQTARRTLADRLELVRQFGSFTVAYSALQPGLNYFDTADGFIAYDEKWGLRFALGDPVAPESAHRALLEDFLDSHRRSLFCHLSRSSAAILEQAGFYVNEMGIDIEIDLASYDFSGRKKAKLRQAARQLASRGYSIRELTAEDVDLAEVQAVSEAWRQGRVRSRRELRFLTRPITFSDEPDVRKFYLFDRRGRIVAFVFLDPIYEHGQAAAYSTSFKRRLAEAPVGAEEGIMKAVIEKLRAEGKASLFLGLVPLYEVDNDEFRASWLLHYAAGAYYRFGNRIFNFKGQADFKHRFRGRHHKVYFATRCQENSLQLLALTKICRAW